MYLNYSLFGVFTFFEFLPHIHHGLSQDLCCANQLGNEANLGDTRGLHGELVYFPSKLTFASLLAVLVILLF